MSNLEDELKNMTLGSLDELGEMIEGGCSDELITSEYDEHNRKMLNKLVDEMIDTLQSSSYSFDEQNNCTSFIEYYREWVLKEYPPSQYDVKFEKSECGTKINISIARKFPVTIEIDISNYKMEE